MASITLNASHSMQSKLLWYGAMTARTKTSITFSDGTNTTIFTGSFTYNSANKITAGTITGFQQLLSGVAQLTVTGLNYSALTAQNFWNTGNKVSLKEALLAGNDTLTGTSGNDTIYGGLGHDTITGGGGNDVIYGGGGNDFITAGAGNDTIYAGDYARITGGAGDDLYVMNAATTLITEDISGGTDTVEAIFSYILGNNIENLTLTGTANAVGQGNTANNLIRGNTGSNKLYGHAGNDTLIGAAGLDSLYGGAGNDMFVFDTPPNSATNIDYIYDMATTDVIALDVDAFPELSTSSTPVARAFTAAELYTAPGATQAATSATRVIYDSTTGIIRYDADGIGGIYAPVTIGYVMPVLQTINGVTSNSIPVLTTANFSVARFIADQRMGNDNLIGTTGADRLNGYDGNDTIDGLAGNDTLNGGTGNDIIYGRDGNDSLQGGGSSQLYGGLGNDIYTVEATTVSVIENAGEGTDTVQSTVSYSLVANVENLTLTGTAATTAVGNSVANILIGNSAANTLSGGGGNDTLTGGAGNDIFLFTSGGVGDVDTITDFATGDKISLQLAAFPALGATGTLASTAFSNTGAATTAAHRIIYNSTTGIVSYDADGSGVGAAVQIALVGVGTALIASDFTIVT